MSKVKEWEYKVERIDWTSDEELTEALNDERYHAPWEIVSVQATEDEIFVFARKPYVPFDE